MPPLWARAVLQQQAVRPLRLTILLDAGSLRSVSPHPPGAGGGEPRSELVDQGLSLPASEQLAQLRGGRRSPDPLTCRVKDRTFSSPQVARRLAQTSLPLGTLQQMGALGSPSRMSSSGPAARPVSARCGSSRRGTHSSASIPNGGRRAADAR